MLVMHKKYSKNGQRKFLIRENLQESSKASISISFRKNCSIIIVLFHEKTALISEKHENHWKILLKHLKSVGKLFRYPSDNLPIFQKKAKNPSRKPRNHWKTLKKILGKQSLTKLSKKLKKILGKFERIWKQWFRNFW